MNIQSQAWADRKVLEMMSKDGYSRSQARIAVRQMQRFTFLSALQRRQAKGPRPSPTGSRVSQPGANRPVVEPQGED